jgi:hypothetical protein
MRRKRVCNCNLAGRVHPRHNPLSDGNGLTEGTCACGASTRFARKKGIQVPAPHKKLH